MSNVILRRRKLGRGSTLGISGSMEQPVQVVRNFRERDIAAVREPINILFRWGCTSSLRELGLPAATTTVNTAEAIQWCSNKKVSRLKMQAAGVPVPATLSSEFFVQTRGVNSGQWVARPATHAQGRQLRHGDSSSLEVFPGGYVSRLIPKVAEYRVFVAQNRVGWVAQKTPDNPEDVAWNVAQGGRFDNVRWGDWPKAVIQAALAAAKVSGCDFCGVDVMVDAGGNAYVLEVNSAPSQTSPYRQQCVAKIFDHIITNGKEAFPDVPDSPRRTWKSYIHPAIRSKEDGQVLRSS